MCVSLFEKRILVSIHRHVYLSFPFFFFFLLSLPVLSGDSEVLKMLNAQCFHGDNTFIFYFLELFLLAVKHGLVLCCIQLASHRQQRGSSKGQTKPPKKERKESWMGHFTDERGVLLIPSTGNVNPDSWGLWCHAKHKTPKIMTHIGFWEVKDGDS